MSGTLTEGTSTITVICGEETATFTVIVSDGFPVEYQKVEYIGATGTQYIVFDNIDVHTSAELQKYEFDIDFKFDEWNSDNGNNIIAGYATDAGCWLGYNNSVGNIAMGGNSGNYFTGTSTQRHQYHYAVSNGAGTVTREDSASISRELGSLQATKEKFVLFSAYIELGDYIATRFNFKGKIYGFTMEYEDTEILHLIPCYRKSDDVIGMYDTVGKVFYTNNGTGTFTKGGDL